MRARSGEQKNAFAPTYMGRKRDSFVVPPNFSGRLRPLALQGYGECAVGVSARRSGAVFPNPIL